jgi:hypothetical protein
LKKDPSFKPSILSQIDSLAELGSDAQGMYRMMRSLERRGLVARLLHRRPGVWYDISWHEGTPKLEQREHGWYDYNYVMDRDGQILFQTKNNRWRIRGIKMTRAQIKREIKQQMLDIERRQQAKN